MTRIIGGDCDGEDSSSAHSQQYVQLPTTDKRSLEYIDSLESAGASRPVKLEWYRLERISGDKRTFEIYVHGDMTLDAAIERLISRYKAMPAERRVIERKTFEAMIDGKNLPLTRHINDDGSDGAYKHCAVQLAWESWLESAGYSPEQSASAER